MPVFNDNRTPGDTTNNTNNTNNDDTRAGPAISPPPRTERDPLLRSSSDRIRNIYDIANEDSEYGMSPVRRLINLVLVVIFVIALCVMLFHYDRVQDGGKKRDGGWPWGGLPKDSRKAAEVLLRQAPVIVSDVCVVRFGSVLLS